MRFSRYRILQLPLKQGYILHTCHRLNSSIIIPIYYGAFKIIIAHILDTNNKKSPIFALLWVKYGGFFSFYADFALTQPRFSVFWAAA